MPIDHFVSITEYVSIHKWGTLLTVDKRRILVSPNELFDIESSPNRVLLWVTCDPGNDIQFTPAYNGDSALASEYLSSTTPTIYRAEHHYDLCWGSCRFHNTHGENDAYVNHISIVAIRPMLIKTAEEIVPLWD